MNIGTEMQSFYPRKFMSYGAMKTTSSSTLTSGALTVGSVYHISKAGDKTTNFPGAVDNELGEFFTATAGTPVYGGAELEDITTGKPTKLGFFYGHPRTLQFIWKLTYNGDDDCTSVTVANPDGTQIDK